MALPFEQMKLHSLLILALSGLLSHGSETPSRRLPNIIFLLTDDQRWDTLGCYGNKIIHTPHLDALSQNGVTFDRAFVTHISGKRQGLQSLRNF